MVIITLNEERNLSACLDALPRSAEIIVLDSGSTDRTCEIAEARGARVFHRAFDNYAAQKNAALGHATRKWILSLDADEVVDQELLSALASRLRIGESVRSAGDTVAYRLRRRLIFLGRKMRYGKTVDYPVRFFARDSGSFSSAIHESYEVSRGLVGTIYEGEILHTSYADVSDYFRRFNDYTSRIARNHRMHGRTPPPMALHVCRPLFEFVSRYFLRLGFLDGYPGYCYALFSSLYTFVKYAKLMELNAPKAASRQVEP